VVRARATVIPACAISVLLLAALAVRLTRPGPDARLIIFHAGSLSRVFKQICEEFRKEHPNIEIFREAAGSRICARKIAELDRPCDIIASADYTVIDDLLRPEYARWNIIFAGNEMVIAFPRDSSLAGQINKNNWPDILLDENVSFGRSDPNADPCGYRTVLTFKLAEKFYNRPGLARRLLRKDRRHVRPKEVDLLSLLEAGELDYIFTYRSLALQNSLEYVMLPDEINLSNSKFTEYYAAASIRLAGRTPGDFITKKGGPILYGVSIPTNAPNRELAICFAAFLLDPDKGGTILEANGQTVVVPARTSNFDELPEKLKRFVLPTERKHSEPNTDFQN